MAARAAATGKDVGIDLFIVKQPIAVSGNSGGDTEMLRWVQAGLERVLLNAE
jgi:hypothetical protein